MITFTITPVLIFCFDTVPLPLYRFLFVPLSFRFRLGGAALAAFHSFSVPPVPFVFNFHLQPFRSVPFAFSALCVIKAIKP